MHLKDLSPPMAAYKDQKYLTQWDDTEFDKLYDPGERIAWSIQPTACIQSWNV